VRGASVWARLLGVDKAMVDEVEFDPDKGILLARVRPKSRERGRCGRCRRRCPGYDQGEGWRRWRTLDMGSVQAFVEAPVPRVRCPEHGVTVAAVPWARHGTGHTRAFDDTVAWLAVACSKTAVCELMQIAWRTVGSIITRVCADVDTQVDRLAGLHRIGIDEISYKKGHKYLTVVVDHDTGRLVWAAPGHDRATLDAFFAALGPQRCALITHVTADAAGWIAQAVTAHCPRAVRCADPFHIVAWATEALDEVRREAWNAAGGRRRGNRHGHGSTGEARELAHSRWALWKNPGTLTDNQRAKLDWIIKTHPRLHRAYLLKEGLRFVFKVKGDDGKHALDRWCSWAQRCRIPQFVKLGRRIKRHLAPITATLEHGLSNALIESTNTKIRLITRMAFGFHHPDNLIALAMLTLGGHRPALPGRKPPTD
jgi:transposase